MKENKSPIGGWIITVLGGGILMSDGFRRRLPVVGFAVVLVLGYMALNYGFQRRYAYIQQLKAEIAELRIIATTTTSQLQSRTQLVHIQELMQKHNITMERGVQLPQIIETTTK